MENDNTILNAILLVSDEDASFDNVGCVGSSDPNCGGWGCQPADPADIESMSGTFRHGEGYYGDPDWDGVIGEFTMAIEVDAYETRD